MWFNGWLLLWTGVLVSLTAYPTLGQRVSPEAPECLLRGEVLLCDYKNSELELVKMEQLQDPGIQKVFLHNARKLHLSESACVNMSLNNVYEVVIIKENSTECVDKFEFSAKNSNINKIPVKVNKLYLEDCKVNSLITSSELSKLNIIGTKIEVFDVSNPLSSGTMAVLQNSQIDNLQKLIINSMSSLLVRKTTISTIAANGLEVDNGSVELKDSIINAPEGSVTLGSGGTLKLQNNQGDITVSSVRNVCKQDQHETTQCPVSVCKESNVYVILFSICFALLVLSLCIIAFVVYYCKETLSKLISRNENSDIELNKTNINFQEGQALMRNNDDQQGYNEEEFSPEKQTDDGGNTSKQFDNRESKYNYVSPIAKEFESYKKDYEAYESITKQHENEVKNSKSTTEEMDLRLKEISRKIEFLIRQKEIEISSIVIINKREPLEISENELEEFKSMKKFNENLAQINEDKIKDILDKIIIDHDKKLFKQSPDISKTLEESFEKLYGKKYYSLRNLALAYISKRVLSEFKVDLQKHYEEEIDEDIKRTNKLIMLMMETQNVK